MRAILLALAAATALTACTTSTTTTGNGVRVYRISAVKTSTIQYRMLDSVNELRAASGMGPMQLNSQLNAAAKTHAQDMSVQNRPWHFGSDGSSPVDRARRVGYSGLYIGETISETFESELQTLSAWMADPYTRRIIMDPRGRNMGFSWHQERNGKIWWVLEVGA
ncbi:Cysteine-rich secretory protein family protein [Aliiroseovarius halocynthiae]|uniref:CAP domain-containing protein n=1 Tax=Aliiroseovarius halocynthiae TaxID=985055 RepID=A0A545SNK4_9RHOB|nr:CAP domain-containing protein [Aliiroseovarius halocynthiae]TQV66570.1 CAP domain-containing protein [Aliiroseovarius halocynthiae]SMR82562.1 Cysteine-rich secretory protein family protein [Aliiroseovarius halocynthiae]